jgi:hypothetical protein
MKTVRDQLVLWETETLPQLNPIHFAGAALLAHNTGDEDVELSIDESANGTEWASVLLSTPTSAGNASVTLAGLSYGVISFVASSAYVRLSLTARSSNGVYCSLVQFETVRAQGVTATGY